MVKWLESRVLWGLLLIVGGVVFLLQNLGLFRFGGLFWALLFVLGGLFFLSIYINNRANWWSLIPGFTLWSIAALLTLDALAPAVAEVLGGALVLGGIGVSFCVVYLIERNNWWALIPAGVMITLAVVASLDSSLPGAASGGIFFLGMGFTFAVLGLVNTPQGPMRWAWIPAGILAGMGLILIAAAEELLGYLWPAVLILAGLSLVLRTLRR